MVTPIGSMMTWNDVHSVRKRLEHASLERAPNCVLCMSAQTQPHNDFGAVDSRNGYNGQCIATTNGSAIVLVIK